MSNSVKSRGHDSCLKPDTSRVAKQGRKKRIATRLASTGRLAINFAVRNVKQVAGGGAVRRGNRLAFIHVPKCGGSSLDYAVRTAMGLSAQISGWTNLKIDPIASQRASTVLDADYDHYCADLLPYYLSRKKAVYVSGHTPLRDGVYNEFRNEWDFVLLLRHPVRRWLSNYFFNRFKQSDAFRINEELDDFIESYRGKRYGCFYVLFLAPDAFCTGADPDAASIEAAVENLKRFSVMGVLEHLESLQTQFAETYGAKLHIPHKNTSPEAAADHWKKVSPEQMKAIEDLCKPDLKVYEKAVQMSVSS